MSEGGAARDAVRNEGAQRLRDEGRARIEAPSGANNQTPDYAFSEGRLVGRFDVDAEIGEKLYSALDSWSKARPEPEGSDDGRSSTQRRADALHQLLDCGGGGGDGLVSAPRTEVNVSVPADHPGAGVAG